MREKKRRCTLEEKQFSTVLNKQLTLRNFKSWLQQTQKTLILIFHETQKGKYNGET
jgi:hypothetical protein